MFCTNSKYLTQYRKFPKFNLKSKFYIYNVRVNSYVHVRIVAAYESLRLIQYFFVFEQM